MKFVINEQGGIIGYTNDPLANGPDVPEDFVDENLDCYVVANDIASLDLALLLAKAKKQGIVKIKLMAQNLIESSDWKLQRAKERDQGGWGTLSDIDHVLAERESIRRSSDAAEVSLSQLTTIQEVQAFSWSVNVIVSPAMRLTRGEFLDRFTELETVNIVAAAQTNATLRAWLLRMENGEWVIRNQAIPGLEALEIAGLLAPGRAAEILA